MKTLFLFLIVVVHAQFFQSLNAADSSDNTSAKAAIQDRLFYCRQLALYLGGEAPNLEKSGLNSSQSSITQHPGYLIANGRDLEKTVLFLAAALGEDQIAQMVITKHLPQDKINSKDLIVAYWLACTSNFKGGICSYILAETKSHNRYIDTHDIEAMYDALLESCFIFSGEPNRIAVHIEAFSPKSKEATHHQCRIVAIMENYLKKDDWNAHQLNNRVKSFFREDNVLSLFGKVIDFPNHKLIFENAMHMNKILEEVLMAKEIHKNPWLS